MIDPKQVTKENLAQFLTEIATLPAMEMLRAFTIMCNVPEQKILANTPEYVYFICGNFKGEVLAVFESKEYIIMRDKLLGEMGVKVGKQ